MYFHPFLHLPNLQIIDWRILSFVDRQMAQEAQRRKDQNFAISLLRAREQGRGQGETQLQTQGVWKVRGEYRMREEVFLSSACKQDAFIVYLSSVEEISSLTQHLCVVLQTLNNSCSPFYSMVRCVCSFCGLYSTDDSCLLFLSSGGFAAV